MTNEAAASNHLASDAFTSDTISQSLQDIDRLAIDDLGGNVNQDDDDDPITTSNNDNNESYIDFDIFLSPSFSPYSFANSLIHATNNLSDTTLDLSTPLSRVLFDLQEIDTLIHSLTTASALPLLNHITSTTDSSTTLIELLRDQLAALNASYARLSKEVIDRYNNAQPYYTICKNLSSTTRLLRGTTRCLLLARQLEIQLLEAFGRSNAGVATNGLTSTNPSTHASSAKKDDPKALVRAAYTITEFKNLYLDVSDLNTIHIINHLYTILIVPTDRQVKFRAQQTIKEFSINTNNNSYNNSATTAAVVVLNVLGGGLLTSTIQTYLQSQLTTSLASISRSLTMLSTLDRTLGEVSVRAGNIVALESLLKGIKDQSESSIVNTVTITSDSQTSGQDDDDSRQQSLENEADQASLLTPLLATLDTPSLPTHFFRTLASNLDPRVREILNRGGVNAKTLREQRERIRAGLRECVLNGVSMGSNNSTAGSGNDFSTGAKATIKGMEGLVGMMVGAVGSLGR